MPSSASNSAHGASLETSAVLAAAFMVCQLFYESVNELGSH